MTIRLGLLVVAISATCTGCSSGGFIPGRWYEFDSASRDCLVVESPVSSADVDASATNPPIRIFASSEDVRRWLTVEPLFRVDCLGRVTAGLADSWSLDAELGAWLFRGDAIESALAQTLNQFSVNVPSVDSVGWVDNSIAVFVAGAVDASELDELYAMAEPVVRSTGVPSEGRVATVADDERDLIDERVDVVVTRSTNVIEYARRDPDRFIAPLNWSRDYVILAPRGLTVSAVEIDNIVRSVVRAEARASVAGRQYADCAWADPGEAVSSVPVRERVVFDETDDVARNIADRVVALALRGDLGGQPLADITAEGVSPIELDRRIKSGSDEYYVASVRPAAADVCSQARRRLVAEWLTRGRIIDVGSTREHVIVSTGGVQVYQDAAGIPYVRRAQQ